MISRLIIKPDKLIQIRILEIYALLLEQTIVENTDEPEGADAPTPTEAENDRLASAAYLRTIIPDLTDHILPMLTLPDCELLIASLEALNAVARSPLGIALVSHESISVLVDLLSFSSRNCDFSLLRFYGPRQPELAHPPLVVTPRIPRRFPAIPAPTVNQTNSPNRINSTNQNQPQKTGISQPVTQPTDKGLTQNNQPLSIRLNTPGKLSQKPPLQR
jgi:hypothetical protein